MSHEPILDLGELGSTPTGNPAHPPPRPRLRVLREPAIFVVGGAATLLFAALLVSDDDRRTTDQTARPSATSSTYPNLVLQSTAIPGETITVVAYRRQHSCGRTLLTFDGHRITYRRFQSVNSPNPGWRLVTFTFDVPTTASRGAHQIALHGPARTTADCDTGQAPGQPTELTSKTIAVGP